MEWARFNIHISKSISIFKRTLLKFIRPTPDSTFGCNITKSLTYMTKMKLGLSHFCDFELKKFWGYTNILFWNFGSEVGTSRDLFLYKQLVYKQLALGWQIAEQLWGLNPLSLCNKKTYRLKKKLFPCKGVLPSK